MRLKAIVIVGLLAAASAAAAQTAPATPAGGGLPPPLPANSNPKLMPDVVQPKPTRRVRPHGEPIVKGNNYIFVDSYGQLSTTMQP